MCRDVMGSMCRDMTSSMFRDEMVTMCKDATGPMCRAMTGLMCRPGMESMMCRDAVLMCREMQPAPTNRDRMGNKYVQGMLRTLHDTERTVRVLPLCDDEAYDRLLTENLVFLCLLDASAVNTVLECIVRNTPIVVYRLPAL